MYLISCLWIRHFVGTQIVVPTKVRWAAKSTFISGIGRCSHGNKFLSLQGRATVNKSSLFSSRTNALPETQHWSLLLENWTWRSRVAGSALVSGSLLLGP